MKSEMRAIRFSSLAARGLAGLVLLVATILAQNAMARSGSAGDGGLQRYIIELEDAPLARYDGRQMSLAGEMSVAGVAGKRKTSKLDATAAANRDYLEFLSQTQENFLQAAAARLGRQLGAAYRYRIATNGLAIDLTPVEAAQLARSPGIKAIEPDQRFQLDTDAGPPWIGAGAIWDGSAGFPDAQGENIIVGVIDSGINWEHPSFEDPSPDGYDYFNPLGQQLGLCSEPEVSCNDKLIGVYDFVQDDPATPDVVEENNNGRDNDLQGHGTHVASIAVGNRLNIFVDGAISATLSGVAPRANLITYRVCYAGEPADHDSSGCMGSAILAAIEQAIDDGVDVINYSIGSSPSNPWTSQIAKAYQSARSAGIFVASSAGNEGPGPGTVGSPANAPWVTAVGNASHNRIFALGFDLIGGPAGLACAEGTGPELQSTIGPAPVVFAGDLGDPLGCSAFPAGSMTGAIALVSRGGCLFLDKADNAAAAGAEFVVVYNNVPGPTVIMSLDESTIPSCMISDVQGGVARDFVQANPGATGRVNYPIERLTSDSFADAMASSSSRGPALPPVEDTLKPNLIAPGSGILAASNIGQEFRTLSGTSMASPHIAGAAALLKSVHGDWGPSQLASALETTASPELANIDGDRAANPRERGTGRPQLGEAANAGLFLEVSSSDFALADPFRGGDPGSLNLPGLVDATCVRNCSFVRTVTDQMGGGDWTATAVDFPPGVAVSVTPSSFSLTNGGSQALNIAVDLFESERVGEWLDGRIRLRAAGAPDQFLTVSAYYSGGVLPELWEISDDGNGGWTQFELSGLVELKDATFTAGGLKQPLETVRSLPQDPSGDSPYDGGTGVFTVWHEFPEGALAFYAETLESAAPDIDLFIGRDDNGDGIASESEELCSSTSPLDLEFCILFDQPPGDYWVVVQNWEASSNAPDEVTVRSGGVWPGEHNNLAVSGPGIVGGGEAFTLRLSWDNLAALPGEEWLGAIGIGTSRENPNNVGVIPVRLTRNAIGEPETLALFHGVDHGLALDAGASHDRMFIDVPPGAGSLTVSADALESEMNDGLNLELRRLGFDAALANPPFAAAPGGAAVVASDSGSGGAGPTVTVSGGALQTGRWYAVLSNGNDSPVAIQVRAEVASQGTALPIHRGLWEPSSRPGLRQGYEYNWGSSDRSLIWYSYEEDGQPAWYIAGSPSVAGNIWVSDLYRVTNDGARQQLATVGKVSVTTLAEDDALFTFTLFGQSGTDRMQPLSALTCPSGQSYTGLWYRGGDGLGGASVVVNASTQAQIHYLFDAEGRPRWLVAQDSDNPEPTNPEMPMLQFTGYCAVCANTGVSFAPMGVLTREFTSETVGSWNLDYLFQAPLSGSVDRTDQIIKLTNRLDCQ